MCASSWLALAPGVSVGEAVFALVLFLVVTALFLRLVFVLERDIASLDAAFAEFLRRQGAGTPEGSE